MIPQIEPWIGEEELSQLQEVVADRWITEGKKTQQFEERIRDYTQAKHAISICNGTAALYVCLKALGIGPGDDVLVPDLTFIATANAVIMAGATPVFVDVDSSTLTMDPVKAQEAITVHTKAIMPVHLYGVAADMEALLRVARGRGLALVEDAAQGIGVMARNRHVGTIGDIGILSFYGNKTITCGEGGMILTQNDALAKKCWMLKNHGREVKGTFIHPTIGYNFCLTDLQAAVGLAQFGKLPAILEHKRRIRETYERLLGPLDDVAFPDPHPGRVDWFTSIIVDDPAALADALKEKGIGSRRFFYPLHRQPAFSHFPKREFPVTDDAYDHGLSLPSTATIPESDIRKVCDAIRDFFKK
ncbi:MAG: DegT/DnrJ/EryC1/StrS family aminotransferase [Candidatus Aenigmarchaeota archaeon]|nr:DegT/DnrJ/EryC1/StrS family aminotransferase [Candidatus Aenigmarchaeota archaeon]